MQQLFRKYGLFVPFFITFLILHFFCICNSCGTLEDEQHRGVMLVYLCIISVCSEITQITSELTKEDGKKITQHAESIHKETSQILLYARVLSSI